MSAQNGEFHRKQCWRDLCDTCSGGSHGHLGRTLLITGIPVTSVFSSIFTRMGFTLKYPFSVQTIPNAGESLGLAAWLSEGIKRLLELLFAPTSGEMLHVFVAWGALSLWFVIALLCVLKLQGISGQYHRYFFWILLPFTAGIF